MMSTLKLHTLKQKLWAIVAASFVARVIMFFALPNTPSSLAPDEGTYAALTKWIGESKPAIDFPGFSEGLYLVARSLIIPASFFYRAGMNELDAVRLTSSIYGLCSLILLVFFILIVVDGDAGKFLKETHNTNLIVTLLLLFAFLPSHLVWSSLGLRESTTEFWLISTFLVFFITFQYRNYVTFPTLLFMFGSIVLTFSARNQIGWVLGVSLILYLLFNLKNSNTFFLIPLVLCAILFGSTLNSGSTLNFESTESTESTGSTGSTGSILSDILKPLLTAGEVISYKQEVNQVDAASVIKTQSCPREIASLVAVPPTKFDTYFCIAWRAPYMLSTFLFRPIIGLDVTSTSSLVAAIENIFWLTLFVTIIVFIFRKRSISALTPALPPLIFFILFLLGASAYQGNMGTGFRHKSLILWVVLLVIFALAWRKPVERVESTRNNSQESAV